MDTERLEALERQIAQLIQAFTRIKEENVRLAQSLMQVHQQSSLEHGASVQEELTHLRVMTRTLQQERELIRDRLAEMLVAVERLEEFARISSDSQV